jgi:sn-glycerol 3-phosphate transport system ATP-binding protein
MTHLYLGLEAVADPVTLRVQGRPDYAEGAQLELYARHADLHPFSKATGRRTG